MKIHRFVVNVPNPAGQDASVQIRLERGKKRDLAMIPGKLPKGTLEIIHAGLSFNPCADRGEEALSLKLEPHSSRDVHVVIATIKTGVAVFHVIDRRKGKHVGGVMLVCADPALVEPAGQTVSVARPCPAVIAKGTQLIRSGTDPSKLAPAIQARPGDAVELVVPITNPTRSPLKNVKIYLEHLGTSTTTYLPAVWNAGVLNRKDVFYATWTLQIGWRESGAFAASVVVASQGTNPVRLTAPFSLEGMSRRLLN